MFKVVTYILAALLVSISAEKFPVCNVSSSTGSVIAGVTLPDIFQTIVEITFLDETKTYSSALFVDYSRNLATSYIIDTEGFERKVLFNYDKKQKAFVTLSPAESVFQECTVEPFSPKDDSILFDWQTPVENHVPTSKVLFGLDKKWTKKTDKDVRGIDSQGYEACIYNAKEDRTYRLELYLSDKDWNVPGGANRIPVRVQEEFNLQPTDANDTAHLVTRFYDFARYEAKIDQPEKVFQIPQGVYCQGIHSPAGKLPKVPETFSFRAEVVDPNTKTVSFVDEWYDKTLKISRFQYKVIDGTTESSIFGNVPVSSIHDFNTGLAYVTDLERQNCTVIPIPQGTTDVRQLESNPLLVRMATPEEFFGLDQIKPNYVGNATVRNIQADTYVAIRTNWPRDIQSIANTTLIWYFSKPTWTSDPGSQPGEDIDLKNLIRMDIIFDYAYGIGKQVAKIYNFYDFDHNPPDYVTTFNTRQCIGTLKNARRVILFDADQKVVVESQERYFRGVFVYAVTTATGISPLRITDFQLSYVKEGVAVSVTLLDKPDVKGDVERPDVQPSLEVAVKRLEQSVKNRNFTLPLVGSINGLTAKSIAKELKREVITTTVTKFKMSPPASGVGGGWVATIGLGTVIVGMLLGGAGLVLFNRFRR